MSITAALGGISALGSAIYGAIASSRRNKEAKELIAQQRQENKDWFNTKMSSDYTQRSDAQAVLKKQREMLAERYRTERAAQAVAGGTDEDIAAAKQADADSIAQTMTGIAENASNYKDQVEQQYRAQDAALNQQQAAALQAQANATAAAAGQAVNAGVGLLGASMNEEALKALRESKDLTKDNGGGQVNRVKGAVVEPVPTVNTLDKSNLGPKTGLKDYQDAWDEHNRKKK